ncbi:unnamed protein product [Medioppia subpectinata]|uniref:Kinesin motor domain-containing protein n=1 Tax=Medioppia subpectinata TaxID=1979941 RepID=A0A7R9PVM0_9ACAR|nr:unnamed protein product [Medioppia subpectinata]CAG2102417.1 unnamed protein product [Medioppia subpectinata]
MIASKMMVNIKARDSKLTSVLKECLGSRLVWTSVVANISNLESNYLDTVSICQFVTRIHRSRLIHNTNKHKMRKLSQHYSFGQRFADSKGVCGESMNTSESESGINCYTSSSEHSVDTVIFCGKSNINHSPELSQTTNKLHYNVSTNTTHNSTQVQTNAQQKEESKDELRCNDSPKHIINDTPVSSPHRSLKESKKSDELWVDGPKRSRRKKDQKPMKFTQELWVDGPKAQLDSGANGMEAENSLLCYHEEKQQRIQQWIQQHTKHIWTDIPVSAQTSPTQTPDSAYCSTVKQIRQKILLTETTDVSCQTELTTSASTVTPSECEFNFEDPLRILSDDEILGIERIAGAGREAMSECCDNNSGSAEDMDDCHSEPITEPPKQLKLEQFLQQLTTITMPRIHTHRDSCHRKDLEYRTLRHPDGASNKNLSISHWDLPRPEFTDYTMFSYLPKEAVNSPTTVTSRPLSATSPPPISTPNEPLFLTSSPNHAVLPTSPRVNRLLGTTVQSVHSSPAKSSVSRKQQKIEQQLKRNTTSTTTSGHGTTSEGECSSVAKKTSSVSSPSFMSHHPIVQRQPASSGYESTIHDDDSDRELVAARRLDIGSTINESIGGTPVKMRNKKCDINSNDDKKNRLSTTSSDHCSFLC